MSEVFAMEDNADAANQRIASLNGRRLRLLRLMVLGAVLFGGGLVVGSWVVDESPAQPTSSKDLERRVARLEHMLTSNSTRDSSLRAGVNGSHAQLGPLLRRLEMLEARIQKWGAASEKLARRGYIELDPSRLPALRASVLDITRALNERMSDLTLLKRNKAVDDGMLVQLLSEVQASSDTNLQYGILRYLDGLTNGVMTTQLQQIALNGLSERVQVEAVECLADLTDQRGVRDWLLSLVKTHPSSAVRDRIAAHVFYGVARKNPDALTELAANTTLDSDVRLQAIRRLQDAGHLNSQLGAHACASLINEHPEQASSVLSYFKGATNAHFAPVLVNFLQAHPDPRLRELAVECLQYYSHDANARAWIQYVAQHDRDPAVRREAYDGLERLAKEEAKRKLATTASTN